MQKIYYVVCYLKRISLPVCLTAVRKSYTPLRGFTALKTPGLFKNQKKPNLSSYNSIWSITTVILPNINLYQLEFLRPWGLSLRASSLTLEAPGV